MSEPSGQSENASSKGLLSGRNVRTIVESLGVLILGFIFQQVTQISDSIEDLTIKYAVMEKSLSQLEKNDIKIDAVITAIHDMQVRLKVLEERDHAPR